MMEIPVVIFVLGMVAEFLLGVLYWKAKLKKDSNRFGFNDLMKQGRFL